MPDQTQGPDLDKLRRLLHDRDSQRRRGADVPEDTAERITRAVLGAPSPDLDCETVQAELPAFVEAELRGAPETALSKRIAAHLRACEECGFLYANMLERELVPDAELAPVAAAALRGPDLVRLRRGRAFGNLRAFVTQMARDILQALQPSSLPDLSYLTEPFFRRARTLSLGARARPSLGAALGVAGRGRAQIPAATRYLAATFMAARDLGSSMKPERVAALRAEGRLEHTARQAALRAASDAGFAQPDAVRFADEFSRLLASSTVELPAIIED